ncbi:hypothetical protein N9273_00075 [bacterium]|nr:hypothetical protein [bacterium]
MDNSKFLDLVEASMPEKDLDKLMRAKRDLQVFLLNKDIKVKAKTFQDIILIELDNGQTVKLEVLDITDPVDASIPAEDGEMDEDKIAQAQKALKAAKAITGVSNARGGMMGRDPVKNVERAVGKLYNKVAKNIKDFTKEF